MKKYLFVLFTLVWLSSSAQFWHTTPALSTSGGSYLIAAHHVKSSIYVVDNNQIFAFSKDIGATWTRPSTTPSANPYVSLTGVANRLYAVKKLNTYDYTLEYTKDDGATWIMDTVGLPINNTKSGKRSLNIKDMGNGYILAYDGTTAVYKKLEDVNWTKTNIDPVLNIDVISHKGTWVATGAQGIVVSTNNGASWKSVNTTGFPLGFIGYRLGSNGKDKLYLSSGPQSGGQIIYLSKDEGTTWEATNSAGIYTYIGANFGSIYAVDDYIIAAVSPAIADFKNPPPFVASSESTPNFMVGDSSGLIRGSTNAPLPFFFHIDNQLFTMFWQLYTSEPGFEGKEVSSVVAVNDLKSKVCPNPTSNISRIEILKPSAWSLTNFMGVEVQSGYALGNFELRLTDLESGIYHLHINNKTQTLIKK